MFCFECARSVRLASHDNGPDMDDDDVMGTPPSSAPDAAAASPVARLDSGMLGPSDGVLPQSFIISTRFHPLLYLTAMMMPTRIGRPDIFVTISPKPHCAKVQLQSNAASRIRIFLGASGQWRLGLCSVSTTEHCE
jgi:hypothetical protein